MARLESENGVLRERAARLSAQIQVYAASTAPKEDVRTLAELRGRYASQQRMIDLLREGNAKDVQEVQLWQERVRSLPHGGGGGGGGATAAGELPVAELARAQRRKNDSLASDLKDGKAAKDRLVAENLAAERELEEAEGRERIARAHLAKAQRTLANERALHEVRVEQISAAKSDVGAQRMGNPDGSPLYTDAHNLHPQIVGSRLAGSSPVRRMGAMQDGRRQGRNAGTREDRAAVKIQSTYRGYAGRRDYRERRGRYSAEAAAAAASARPRPASTLDLSSSSLPPSFGAGPGARAAVPRWRDLLARAQPGPAVAHPPELKSVLGRLMGGDTTSAVSYPSPLIPLCIVSDHTFFAEKAVLVNDVLPFVRDVALARGLAFEWVDIKGGLQAPKGAGPRCAVLLDDAHRLHPMCVAALEMSLALSPSVATLALIGDCPGASPLPLRMPGALFHRLYAGTDLAGKQLLERSYRPDPEDAPSKVAEHGVVLAAAPPPASSDRGAWEADREALARMMRANAPQDSEAARLVSRSLVGHEVGIALGDPRKLIAVVREIEGGAEARGWGDYVDWSAPGQRAQPRRGAADPRSLEEARGLKEAVRRALRPDRLSSFSLRHYPPHEDREYLSVFADAVCESLTDAVLAAPRFEADPLAEEVLRHRRRLIALAGSFAGREDALPAVDGYVAATHSCPLVIFGEPGSGKSALLARTAHEAKVRRGNAVVVTRFSGLTLASRRTVDLVASLCEQICAAYGRAFVAPRTRADLSVAFLKCLSLASATAPLVVILDGLDELTADGGAAAADLSWVPAKLPPHARLLLSAATGSRALASLRAVVKEDNKQHLHFYELVLDPLRAEALARELAERHQAAVSRAAAAGPAVLLSRQAVGALVSAVAKTPSPLYARVAVAVVARQQLEAVGAAAGPLNHASAHAGAAAAASIHLPLGIDALVHLYLEQLERLAGAPLVRQMLAHVLTSRNGLSLSELTQLLVGQMGFAALPLRTVVAELISAGLLVSVVEATGELLSIAQPRVRSIAKARYLASQDSRTEATRALAGFFDGHLVSAPAVLAGRRNRRTDRALEELPWCLEALGNWKRLAEVVCTEHAIRVYRSRTDDLVRWVRTAQRLDATVSSPLPASPAGAAAAGGRNRAANSPAAASSAHSGGVVSRLARTAAGLSDPALQAVAVGVLSELGERGVRAAAEAVSRSLEALEKDRPASHEVVTQQTLSLCSLHRRMGDRALLEGSVRLLARCRAGIDQRAGRRSPELIPVLVELAETELARGQPQSAHAAVAEAQALQRAQTGATSYELAMLLVKQADIHLAVAAAAASDVAGKNGAREAKTLLDQALPIIEASGRGGVGPILVRLARCLAALGTHADAERALRKAEELSGATPDTLSLLGSVLLRLNRPKDAEQALDKAVTLSAAEHGPDSPEVALLLVSLAGIYTSAPALFPAKAQTAEPLMTRALSILETAGQGYTAEVVKLLRALAKLSRDSGRARQADAYEAEARDKAELLNHSNVSIHHRQL